ncbi:MAG TPA: RNA polymerase factor sigma-54 [Pirellulaceae bacterium]|nr:RNA polymerase factor sigma-54 [Pirellulaceae bacterium]
MRLNIGQTQNLKMLQKLHPKMIQSMEILQLPIMSLQERIEQELNENPILEVQEIDPALPEETSEDIRDREEDRADVDEKPLVVDEAHDLKDDFERLVNMDQDVPEWFDERPRVSSNRISEESDRQADMLASIQERPESLNDYLLHQLHELDIDERVSLFAERIISTLDASNGGYLRTGLKDLLPPDATENDLALAQEALAVVQSLDPPGVAARDLRECLTLQLRPDMPFYEELRTLIADHLGDLRDNRLPQIERATGYSLARIQAAWDHLKRLNPRPAATFSEEYVPTVTPDVFLDRKDDGTYKVRLEDDRVPSLFISPYYRKRLQNGEATTAEKEYLQNKFRSAQWLIDSIEQRRETLTKVAQAIVDAQKRFLDEGPEAIEPLKMQQIADQVGVHVTTVSRAVDSKWIQTPRGLFPLKRFFVGGTQNAEGDDVAWDIVRLRLQELIDNEDKRKPHSDDVLMKLLNEKGLNVARRTITKYREKMGIPSSRQRRDWAAARASTD